MIWIVVLMLLAGVVIAGIWHVVYFIRENGGWSFILRFLLGVICVVAIIALFIGSLWVSTQKIGEEYWWIGPVVVLGVSAIACPSAFLIRYLIKRKRDKEAQRIREEREREEQRIKEEKRIKSLQDELKMPLPEISLICEPVVEGAINDEALRLNNKYTELVRLYNEFLKAENKYNWLKRKKDVRGELGLEGDEDFENELKLANEEKDLRHNAYKSFDSDRLTPSEELTRRISWELDGFFKALNKHLYKSSSEVNRLFFKDVSYLNMSDYEAYLFPLYCVILGTKEPYYLDVVDYSEIKVENHIYTERSYNYSPHNGEELDNVRYKYENQDGTRDKRYLLKNNPATYYVRRGRITLTIGRGKSTLYLKTGKEAQSLERVTKDLIKVFKSKAIRKLIEETYEAHEKKSTNKRSTK
ncbi:MAG: DUF308 domain-containing protein [Clostridia bacterium]|nr:DUF308 domain-containing protein [Clostridia bacterium]